MIVCIYMSRMSQVYEKEKDSTHDKFTDNTEQNRLKKRYGLANG